MKNIIIAILIIAVLAVGAYFLFFSNSSDIKLLEKEVEHFVQNTATNAEIVTKGEIATVEKILKDDYKKVEAVAVSLKSTAVEDILTAENYVADGVDFVESKLTMQNLKTTIENDIESLKSILNDAEVQVKIEEHQLSEKAAKIYKEFLAKSKIEEAITKLEAEKEILAEKITAAENAIAHLLNNKDKWHVVEGEFKTLEDGFKTELEDLVNKVKSIGKK